jgi:hypothetical protein
MHDTVLHDTKYKITILYITTIGDEKLFEMNNNNNNDL